MVAMTPAAYNSASKPSPLKISEIQTQIYYHHPTHISKVPLNLQFPTQNSYEALPLKYLALHAG